MDYKDIHSELELLLKKYPLHANIDTLDKILDKFSSLLNTARAMKHEGFNTATQYWPGEVTKMQGYLRRASYGKESQKAKKECLNYVYKHLQSDIKEFADMVKPNEDDEQKQSPVQGV